METQVTKTVVWWDVNTCPVPCWYDASFLGSSIESKLKDSFGPCNVSISAIGNTKAMPTEKLSSSGVYVRHSNDFIEDLTYIVDDWIRRTKRRNELPAKIMVISNENEEQFDNLFTKQEKDEFGVIFTSSSEEFSWRNLLRKKVKDVSSHIKEITREPPLVCFVCQYPSYSVDDFNIHLSSYEHTHPLPPEEESEDEEEETIAVWWNIDSCPVPTGTDPLSIRPTILSWLEHSIRHSSCVTIYAMGDIRQVPSSVLKAVSSSGICITHTEDGLHSFYSDMILWTVHNPSPASIAIITDEFPHCFHGSLYLLEEMGYKFIRTYEQKYFWTRLLNGTLVEANTQSQNKSKRPTPFWLCSLCDFQCRTYQTFFRHLSGVEHQHNCRFIPSKPAKLQFGPSTVPKSQPSETQ